jgi:hypothetical protein
MNEIELLQKIAKYVQLVYDMRHIQKDYFKDRRRDSLMKSIVLESKIDSQNAVILQAVNDLLFVANEVQKMNDNENM